MNEFSFKRTWGPTPKYEMVLNYKRPKNNFILISGPCSLESKDQIRKTAAFVSSQGSTHLRSGVFRAGTYPGKSFGWIDESLIKEYYYVAQNNGLQNIIEVLDYRDIDKISKYCTALQVGARQNQNYTLLKEVGKSNLPIFLKRNMGSTLDEWLGAAEYILQAGCKELYLIERGSSTFMNDVRWSPMIHVIPSAKSICDIPIIFDPCHSCGRRDLVPSIALAGIAAGADGLLIETHPDPEKSISDSEQALSFDDYRKLISKVNKLREVL